MAVSTANESLVSHETNESRVLLKTLRDDSIANCGRKQLVSACVFVPLRMR